MYKSSKIFIIILLLISSQLLFPNNKAEGRTLFPDITNYRNEIVFLADSGVINGYQNGNFGPNDSIKRLQAVQMIIRELGIRTGDAPNPKFKDVHPGSYGYNEIAKAAQLGIISGKSDGTFDPFGQLTRGQMAIILVNAYKLKGTYHSNFKDVSAKDMRLPYIQTLAAHNITTGYADGTFRPNTTLTRAHFAAFMARLLNEDFKPNGMSTLSTEKLANSAQSVVGIELYDENDELISLGSGFIVANQLIATSFHVISGGASAIAITESGEEIKLEGVVAYDDYLDIALLKPTKKLGYPSLPLTNFNSVKTGEKVVSMSSGFGVENTISTGIISGTQILEDEFGDVKTIQTTATITDDSSGGPLINNKGFVLGIKTFDFEGINFAISSDYVIEYMEDYKHLNFNKIQTEKFIDMPVFEFDDEEDWDDETLGVKPPKPIDLEPLKGTKQTLSDQFIDAVHDPEFPVVYGINRYGELISINHETKNIKKIPFNLPAEKIFYQNGELYITLLKGEHSSSWQEETQEGAVAIVDPSTLKIKKVFDINIDPYGVVADDHYFYVSSGSGQWTFIKSFSKETGLEVSSQLIRQESALVLHPNKDRIYAVDSDISPRDIEVFPINNGVLAKGYDSPYHGDYDLSTTMTITPDGKYIFNYAGTIFVSSRLQSTNMHFVTDLNTKFTAITFNNDLSQFYLAIAKRIYVYDYESFTPTKTYSIDGEGYFLFNYKDHLVVVGKEKSATTGIANTFILKATMP